MNRLLFSRSLNLLIFCLATLLAGKLHAQYNANIQGTVTDPAGRVLSGAEVLLLNTGTNVQQTDHTNGSGTYRFSSLAPGSYTVSVTGAGFTRSETSVSLFTGETRGLDVRLTVAATTADVTVRSVASELNPEETRIQTTLTSDEISRLPIPNRDIQMLIQLAPGATGFVNETNQIGYGNSIFNGGSGAPNVQGNGLSSSSNLFLFDDLPVMDQQAKGSAIILPNADMIAEVALQTQTYSVENGESASIQTAYTTKSGSNALHGTMDYTYTGKSLSATPDFSPTLAGFHRYDFIGSLGGPIIKDRTFFFGSTEVLRSIGAGGSLNQWIAPEIAQWASTAYPNANGPKALLYAPPTRDFNGVPTLASAAYPNTPTTATADASGCETAATNFLPCDTPVYYSGNARQPNAYNGLQWNVRLDQYFRSGKDRLYGQYTRLDQTSGFISDRARLDGSTPSQNKYFSVNYTHIFTPNLLNEAHFGNARIWIGSIQNDKTTASIPVFPIIFGPTFLDVQTTFTGQIDKEHTYAFRDSLVWTHGRHNIRAGYQFFRGDFFQDSSALYGRPFVPSFFDLLDFLQDQAFNYSLYTIGGDGKYLAQIQGASVIWHSLFVEDQWKVNKNLSLTLGLRYDNFGNPGNYGKTSQRFVPLFLGTGDNLLARVLDIGTRFDDHAFAASQNWNFMPRGGFAWEPHGNAKMLVKGGIGLYENAPTPFQIAGTLPTQPPNRLSLSPNAFDPATSQFTSPIPYGDFKTVSPPYGYTYPNLATFGADPHGNIYSSADHSTVLPSNINGYDRNLKPEKVLNYSLGTELAGPAKIVFGIAYAGSHGYDELYNDNYNLLPGGLITNPSGAGRITQEWGSIKYGRNGLESNYNALITSVRQSYKTLSWQASYSWSHALSDAPAINNASAQTSYSAFDVVYQPHQHYATTSTDVPNAFSLAGSYEVARIFQNRYINEAASDWRVGSIITAQTGTPFTVVNTAPFCDPRITDSNNGEFCGNSVQQTFGGDYLADNAGTFSLPDVHTSHHGGFTRTQAKTQVFRQGDFTAPGNYYLTAHQGDESINSFRNPGYFNVDLSLAKGFKIPWFTHDGATVLLRGEAVNLLNRANLGAINNDVNGSFFGQSSSANSARFLQLGGRFEF